jgi:hypothetical protein
VAVVQRHGRLNRIFPLRYGLPDDCLVGKRENVLRAPYPDRIRAAVSERDLRYAHDHIVDAVLGPRQAECAASPREDAPTHQFGAKKHSFTGGKTPWGDIPARPFLGLSAADRVEVLAILQEHLERAAGR